MFFPQTVADLRGRELNTEEVNASTSQFDRYKAVEKTDRRMHDHIEIYIKRVSLNGPFYIFLLKIF